MIKERAIREQGILGSKILRTRGWKPVKVKNKFDDIKLNDSIKTINRRTPLP